MAQAKAGDTVKVFYTGKLDDETVFDSNVGEESMEFTIGQGQLIPGFENAVLGMNVGDSTKIHIAADDAYGPYLEDRLVVLPRSEMPAGLDPQVGQRLQFGSPEGRVIVLVTETSPESITVDGNHPLAGKDLTFEIQLTEIA
jgi:peptidylprolyl isomerase